MTILRTKGRKQNRRRKIRCKKCDDHHHHPRHHHHHHHNNNQELPIGKFPLKQEKPGVSTALQAAPVA
jgi:hypothetical protein